MPDPTILKKTTETSSNPLPSNYIMKFKKPSIDKKHVFIKPLANLKVGAGGEFSQNNNSHFNDAPMFGFKQHLEADANIGLKAVFIPKKPRLKYNKRELGVTFGYEGDSVGYASGDKKTLNPYVGLKYDYIFRKARFSAYQKTEYEARYNINDKSTNIRGLFETSLGEVPPTANTYEYSGVEGRTQINLNKNPSVPVQDWEASLYLGKHINKMDAKIHFGGDAYQKPNGEVRGGYFIKGTLGWTL